MALILDPKPYLLYETADMIYMAVNHLSTLTVRDRMCRSLRGNYEDNWYRRLGRLQEIQEECCRDLDMENEMIQHFFRQIENGCTSEYTHLAYVITRSFACFQSHSLEGEARALKEKWKDIQAKGCKIWEGNSRGINVFPVEQGQSARSISEQIYALKYPAELRLELLNAFLNYDAEIDRLVELLRPYAQRLERCLEAEPWLMDSTVEYWRRVFETTSPEAYLGSDRFFDSELPMLEQRRVCFQLIRCGEIFGSHYDENNGPNGSLFVFGSAVLAECSRFYAGANRDWVLSALRSISDKTKFEIISRLSREPSYCQKLADELDCHTGNISRNLTSLWKDGFLVRREGESRIYYETDRERLATFLREVYDLLSGDLPTDE